MARRGFIANNAPQTGVTTAYHVDQGIALDGTGTLDPGTSTLPGAVYLSHIEIQCTQTGATAATLTFWLSWDNLGNYPASGESAATTLLSGLTDTARRGCAVSLGVWIQANARQTTPGTLYLWGKTNAGTVTVLEARIYWRQDR